MTLEVFSISLVIPLLTSLTNPDFTQGIVFGYLQKVNDILNRDSIFKLIVFILVAVYFLKIIFLIFLSWYQANFVWNLQAFISSKLFKNYMKQDYAFFFSRNSSELLRNTMGESGQFSGAVMALANLISELLVVLGICILLLFYQPILAAGAILLLSSSTILFYLLIRNKIKEWGKSRQYHEGLRYKNFQEGIGALKDIKLMAREDNIINLFSTHTYSSTHASKFNTLLQTVPRLWLELILIIVLAIALLTLNASGQNFNSFLPLLGVMAAATFRIMPSINRIMYSLQSLRFADAVIMNLQKELNLKFKIYNHENQLNLNFRDSIEINKVSYQYPSSNYRAISEVDFIIKKGDKVGIMGATGSGKSTLLDVILGFLDPTKGSILIDGISINDKNRKAWQNLIGYVSQNIYLIDDTLKNNIALGINPSEIDNEDIKASIEKAQLESFIDTLPEGLDTFVGESGIKLSGGQKQRIAIARSLYHQPDIIVFDEASSALDAKTEENLFEAINLLSGKTVIIVTHREASLKNCNLVINLSEGKISGKESIK